MVGASAAAMVSAVFASWYDIMNTLKVEAEIRKEYAEEIDAAEKRLQDYILQQTQIMKNMINKRHLDTKEGVFGACFKAFVDELGMKNDRLQKEEEMKQLEERMAAFSKDQAAKSKKVLSRLNAGSDQGLMTLCLTAWVQFIAEYNKNRAFEDAVKAEEKKIQEFMKAHNEGSKGVLSRMSAATDSGLVQSCFKGWVDVYEEQKKANELEDIMANAQGKFATFGARNKASAGSAMDRSAAAAEMSTLIVIF